MFEKEKIKSAQEGGWKSIEEICSSTWENVYRFVYFKVQNCQEAEDITQETYVKAIPYFQRNRIETNKHIGFLKTISLNILRDKWRKNKRWGIKVNLEAINPEEIAVEEGKSTGKFKTEPRAVLGKINDSIAEIQSPTQEDLGILAGGGAYASITNLSPIRWQEGGFEYAVVGYTSLEQLSLFIKELMNGVVQIPLEDSTLLQKPQIKVPVQLEIEENEQKSVDGGHSPWRLDPVHGAQVFVSLKISP